MASANWLPLESNPDVINKYLVELGVPKEWGCVDVFGLEPDLLQMVPRPVAGVFLLFPISPEQEADAAAQVKKLQEGGDGGVPKGLYFITQKISNACGTIALIHVLANSFEAIGPKAGSILAQFYAATKGLGPDAKAKALDSSEDFHRAHETLSREGQTAAPNPDDKVDLHFIALIHKDGVLYELDGRKPFPIPHGKTSPETLMEDSAKVIQTKFIAKQPENLRFTVMALAKTA